MAVALTGAIYKALEFDGVSSRTYGVYITGEAVYNAPERDVEMVTIPGRNGTYALDRGRFENIEVSYPAGIFADTEADFRQAISEFRNFLCSRKGYVRLQDEYNPDEYRLAVYKSGLEVEPAMLKAGEFKITFDCKPQRFLTSGETAVSVDSGDTLTNPTLFEASPLLKITGYGHINFNGYEININDEPFGDIELFPSKQWVYSGSFSKAVSYNVGQANVGDIIHCSTFNVRAYTPSNISSYTETVTGSGFVYTFNTSTKVIALGNISFSAGTAELNEYEVIATLADSTVVTITIGMEYDGNETVTFYFTKTPVYQEVLNMDTYQIQRIVLHSTAGIVNPYFYIDTDIGEAYKNINDEYTSLNAYIDLGSKLPKLAVGENEITFDNTITDLKVTPRWWKI